jgi:glycerol-3-phosphate transporter
MAKSFIELFKSASPAERKIQDPAEIKKTYRRWRIQILASIFVGYAIFYFLRKNLSAATPALLQDLHYSKADVGKIWSTLYLVYAVSKFVNGIFADHSNPRYFLAFGLMLSAIFNLLFGFSTALTTLCVVWALNGWFQGMGATPCTKSLVQWFSLKERGTYWAIWSSSHQVGGAAIMVLAGWLTAHYGWRSAFFVPSLIGMIVGLALLFTMRDSPESIGLPSIEKFHGEKETDSAETKYSMKEVLFNYVLNNKFIWLVAIGNFFVYIVRYGAMDWAPTYLVEAKGSSITGAALKVAAFEVTGIAGSFAAGYISDRFFSGRRGPVNVLYMFLVTIGIVIFWLNPPNNPMIDAIALGLVGFLIYGPQMLVGVAAADFAGKHAAATSNGFTGFMGYIGSIVSGYGIGWTVDHFGWDGGFKLLVGCAIFGMLCFIPTWKKAGVS